MLRPTQWLVVTGGILWIATATLAVSGARQENHKKPKMIDQDPVKNATAKVERGRHTFRFDTFGDQAFWGDTLKLHQAIEGAALGGVGPGVSPRRSEERRVGKENGTRVSTTRCKKIGSDEHKQ